MIIKKFQGASEIEAIMKAKDELGSNAVIMNVKEIKHKGLGKLFRKSIVEVTAAVDEPSESVKERKRTTAERRNI